MATSRHWCCVTILSRDGETLATAELSGPGAPDGLAVDAVGRLALAARRISGTARLTAVCGELADLLEISGLVVEMEGHPEGREQPLRIEHVEEEAHPGDSPV